MFVKKGKLKCIAQPRYDPTTGQFLGLYESLGFIAGRGTLTDILWTMAIVKRIQRFFALTIKEGFLVRLVARFSV